MKFVHKRYLGYLIMGFVAAVIATFFLSDRYGNRTDKKVPDMVVRDYPQILASGYINATTEYNSVSYFVDKNSIDGFHYQLFLRFSHDKGLVPQINPEMSYKERVEGLKEGKFDIIAYSIPTTSELKDSLFLTRPIALNKQILVQRKSADNDSMFISNHLDLANKKLYVVKASPSILRIQNLSDEIGDTIYIEEVDRYGAEQLLAMVAHGDIDYAVCDEDIALASIDLFPELDITTDISFTQFYSWGVNKESPLLLDTLNAWLDDFTKTKEYQALYRKYYNVVN